MTVDLALQHYCYLKGLRPLPPTPADSRILGFLEFLENVDFGNLPMGFGVWERLQWIGNGCGLQKDGSSAHFDLYDSIFDDFHDFGDFAVISDGLMLFPEGPGTSESALKVPGPFGNMLWWSDAASGRPQDLPRVS